MWKSKAIITILVVAILLPTALTHAGVILSTHKYAWSNNVGYINFENVIVNDGALSGYAWSENTGWIKFNPSKGGFSMMVMVTCPVLPGGKGSAGSILVE